MIRFSKLLFIATIVVIALWQLPWLYRFATTKINSSPFILYSPIIHDFAMISHRDGKIYYGDANGNQYSEKEFDAILPTFYVRQLVSDGHFPDTIDGVAVTPRQIQHENFRFRSSPTEINRPSVGLYYLLESMSGRVDLAMPDDVFRITANGVEFLDIERNRLKEQKSNQFTEMMKRKGFVFPAKVVAGNPTSRKEYDEGYLLTDQNDRLFHLKQTQGLPYVRAIDIPDGLKIAHLFVTEHPSRRTLGFLTDENHSFYVLRSKSYEIVKVEIPSFHPTTDYLSIFGDLFYVTIYVENEQSGVYYAVAADDFRLVNSHKTSNFDTIKRDFPLSIKFTEVKDKFVKPRL